MTFAPSYVWTQDTIALIQAAIDAGDIEASDAWAVILSRLPEGMRKTIEDATA